MLWLALIGAYLAGLATIPAVILVKTISRTVRGGVTPPHRSGIPPEEWVKGPGAR